jgi:hypothetical protein
MAWVRVAGAAEELVVASDSRLRGGFAWDAAPKLLPLPRNDSVLGFAGSTDYAYPLMLQAANTVMSRGKSLNRGQPLEELKGHLLRVMNGMLDQFKEPPVAGHQTPDALFLLAGFSWKSQAFRIWTLHYDRSIPGFTFRPAKSWRGGHDRKTLAVVGDSVDAAKNKLVALLRDRKKLSAGSFDLEPLEVLSAMIRDKRYVSIGGYPQVVKVYKSLSTVPFCVRWTDAGSERLTLLGRPLLNYEFPDRFPTLALPFL